jgi:hypothetical protein
MGLDGDVYLACHSPSADLPIEAAPSKQLPDRTDLDAFVVRIRPKDRRIVYATRIGGSDYDEVGRIKVDREGFVYAVGFTKSQDFPTTEGALQPAFGGGDSGAFLIRVAPDGRVVYTTLLGGSAADQGNGLELDDKGGVFVGGTTWSSDFPRTRWNTTGIPW